MPHRHPNCRRRRHGLAVITVLALAIGAGSAASLADVSSDAPTFSLPTEISHTYAPFVPGTVKVFGGRSHGASVTIIESHSRATRSFTWNDSVVECSIVEEMVFHAGELMGQEQHFVAQADDGAVWSFGEIEDSDPNDDGGNDGKNEPGGWIVGQRAISDPIGISEGAEPALWMPAFPEAGDIWASENVQPDYLSTLYVRSTRSTARTSAGRFGDCLRISEHDVPASTHEWRWFAPGVGLVRSQQRGERVSLRATSLRTPGRRTQR